MKGRRVSSTGLRITTILVTMVVGVVSVILCCCIFLFLDRYRSAMVQSAQTSSAQAVLKKRLGDCTYPLPPQVAHTFAPPHAGQAGSSP